MLATRATKASPYHSDNDSVRPQGSWFLTWTQAKRKQWSWYSCLWCSASICLSLQALVYSVYSNIFDNLTGVAEGGLFNQRLKSKVIETKHTYISRNWVTFALIGKDHILVGWPSKIEATQVPRMYGVNASWLYSFCFVEAPAQRFYTNPSGQKS